ncbi:MAG: isochorismatase family protein [Propionibacteriaceae bacterium]|jgi:nicotinamidase-related amidase|nr:isochorismatase family protein [Propionibacteriaceae bacterium]
MTIRRGLVVVDVQQQYFDGPLKIQYPPVNDVLEAVLAAIAAAQAADIPVALILHENPVGAVVFAAGSDQQRLHPRLDVLPGLARFAKAKASIFSSPEFNQWLVDNQIDTVTLVGFMSNNCLLASAAAAETYDVAVEVLSDASGAINLTNEAGAVTAQQLHKTIMVVLHSNWAAVATSHEWTQAITESKVLAKSNLVVSAMGSVRPD